MTVLLQYWYVSILLFIPFLHRPHVPKDANGRAMTHGYTTWRYPSNYFDGTNLNDNGKAYIDSLAYAMDCNGKLSLKLSLSAYAGKSKAKAKQLVGTRIASIKAYVESEHTHLSKRLTCNYQKLCMLDSRPDKKKTNERLIVTIVE